MCKTIKPWLRCGCLILAVSCAACMEPFDSDSSVATAASETSSLPPPPAVATPLASDGSIAALTAEVRQLRVAVEELARSQQEAQTRTAVLSDQQSRVERAAADLQNIRARIESATFDVNRFDSRLSSLNEELLVTTQPGRRREVEQQIRSRTTEKNIQESELQLAKNLERELLRAFQTEQREWDELVGVGR